MRMLHVENQKPKNKIDHQISDKVNSLYQQFVNQNGSEPPVESLKRDPTPTTTPESTPTPTEKPEGRDWPVGS